MNSIDLMVIYLACGAPFAVYFFLQNRKKLSQKRLWLETLLIFAFWLLFAFRFLMLNRKFGWKFTKSPIFGDSNLIKDRKLFLFQKQFEEILIQSSLQISVFEFREIIERYIGLTLAKQNNGKETTKAETEIFRIINHKNTNLAAACLHRRNRKRLFFHQTLAGQDFLNIIAKLSEFNSLRKRLGNLSIEFVTLLNDLDALAALENLFGENLQIDEKTSVNYLEKDLWNTEQQKPLQINPISTHLQNMTATTNLRVKD